MKVRCAWAGDKPIMVTYHDTEWGTPLHDDKKLFEFLVLESFQAGLSWLIVLQKRENFRKAFANFNVKQVAKFEKKKISALTKDAGIVRNRLKIEAAVNNAQRFLEIQKEFGSFDAYVWSFVHGKTIVSRRKAGESLPPTSSVSDAMSADMDKRGFKFRGSTICYAFMQAVGMVNDHATNCFRYSQLA